jgi:hypothetical protein
MQNAPFAPFGSKFYSITEKLILSNAYPESIQTPDKYVIPPFLYACLNQALSLEVLMLFVSLYPEALKCF